MGGVTRRVTCTWLLGLAVKVPWLGPCWPILALAAWTGFKTLLSPCRGLISDMEGCLGPERVYDNQSADYCKLVNEWAWSRSRVCLLRLEVDFGSVLELELGQEWRYGALKASIG